MKILFICHANVCRSFMAQEILTRLLPKITAFSRGLYVDAQISVPEKITHFLASQGIEAKAHTPTQLTPEDLQKADFIFCMEPEHLDFLLDRYAQHTDKLWLLNDFAFGKKTAIEDPIGLTGRAFEKQAQALAKAVQVCAERFKQEFPQLV